LRRADRPGDAEAHPVDRPFEIWVAAGSAVGLEIPVGDRHLDLTRVVLEERAGEALFLLTLRGAAVAVVGVAVVALLFPGDEAVAAGELRHAVDEGGFVLASRRAAVAGNRVAVVAALPGFDGAVATLRFVAGLPRGRASVP